MGDSKKKEALQRRISRYPPRRIRSLGGPNRLFGPRIVARQIDGIGRCLEEKYSPPRHVNNLGVANWLLGPGMLDAQYQEGVGQGSKGDMLQNGRSLATSICERHQRRDIVFHHSTLETSEFLTGYPDPGVEEGNRARRSGRKGCGAGDRREDRLCYPPRHIRSLVAPNWLSHLIATELSC
jgi:hypothetical protein